MIKQILFVIGMIVITHDVNTYCDGWDDGYIAGYCYEDPNCIEPLVPICPTPTINCNSGYKCGYNRGFVKGKKDKKNKYGKN